MKNSELRQIADRLDAIGVNLDDFTEVTISMSEARETVVIARPGQFAEAQVFVQQESTTFYRVGLSHSDAQREIRAQNQKARAEDKA